jgi:hypothetical protein
LSPSSWGLDRTAWLCLVLEALAAEPTCPPLTELCNVLAALLCAVGRCSPAGWPRFLSSIPSWLQSFIMQHFVSLLGTFQGVTPCLCLRKQTSLPTVSFPLALLVLRKIRNLIPRPPPSLHNTKTPLPLHLSPWTALCSEPTLLVPASGKFTGCTHRGIACLHFSSSSNQTICHGSQQGSLHSLPIPCSRRYPGKSYCFCR